MKKLSTITPKLEDIFLFICPRPVVGDFAFLGARGEHLTVMACTCGDWAIVNITAEQYCA